MKTTVETPLQRARRMRVFEHHFGSRGHHHGKTLARMAKVGGHWSDPEKTYPELRFNRRYWYCEEPNEDNCGRLMWLGKLTMDDFEKFGR